MSEEKFHTDYSRETFVRTKESIEKEIQEKHLEIIGILLGSSGEVLRISEEIKALRLQLPVTGAKIGGIMSQNNTDNSNEYTVPD